MGKLEGIRVGDGVRIRWKREIPTSVRSFIKGGVNSLEEEVVSDGIVLRKYWKLNQDDSGRDRVYVKEYCIAIGSLSSEKHRVVKEESIILIERVEISVEEMLTCKNWEIREMIKSIGELIGK